MGLRGHLLWLVLAAVLPAALFSAGLIYRIGDEQRRDRQAEIVEAAEALARDIDAEMRRTISALEVLAVSNVLATGDLAGFHAVAKRVLASHPDWANIVLSGPQGEHLVNLNRPYGAALPPLRRPDVFLDAARARGPAISNATRGVTLPQLLTVVAVPVMDAARVKYVLAAAQMAGNWERLLKDRLPPGMHATLLDRDHIIVARTLGNERFVGTKPVPAFLDVLRRQPEGGELDAKTREGFEGRVVYRRLPFGWTVATFMPKAALERPVRQSLAQLASGFLLILAASLAVAWLLGRRIADTISRLADSVRGVGQGEPPLALRTRIREVREAEAALGSAAHLLDERLRREQAARTELEAADRAKDEYFAMLAHELRNPLAPINAALFILEDEALSSEAARRARTVVGRQVQHLARLVDDLLDVTRLASGKVELRREVVSLNEVLRQSAEDHGELAARKNVALVLDLPPRPVRVRGDITRLAQVAGNLLQNAIAFTPPGGRVTLSLAGEGARAQIRVRDTGAGIEPQLLERLFEPFTQGVQAASRAKGGLGLGLALVKGLAELHGGTVRACSEGPGLGAEFVVTLPALADS